MAPPPSLNPTTYFTGTRLTYHSMHPFYTLLSRLYASVGNTAIAAAITSTTTPSDFAALITPVLGPHGFMFFAQFNHSSWLPVYKLDSMANPTVPPVDHHLGILRAVIGSPLVAETMLQYDLTAGLALPVEILLLETSDRMRCDVVYQLPSALVAGFDHDLELLEETQALDAKLKVFVEYLVV